MGARMACSTRAIGASETLVRPGSEDDRRDHDMQPIQAPGGEEARHRVGAAFDQDAAKAAFCERRQYGCRRDLPAGEGKATCSTPAGSRVCVSASGHDNAPDAVIGKQPGSRRQAAAGVDHHPRRAWPGNMANGQLGIVRHRRADPDHHGINQRAQSMQVGKPGCAIDIV